MNLATSTLPHSLLAERMVLGIILSRPDAMTIASRYLNPEAFYIDVHRLIYQAALEIYKNGRVVDYVTLITWFEDNKKTEEIADLSLIANFVDKTITLGFLEDYISLVYDKYLRRSLIELGSQIIDAGFLTEVSLEKIFLKIEEKLSNLNKSYFNKNFSKTSDILYQILEDIKEQLKSPSPTGLLSSFYDLDSILHGFQKSDLIIIAGRPSMGKTAFALNIVKNIVESFDISVAFFSLELSRQQLIYRLLSTETLINQARLKAGKISKKEWLKINQEIVNLSKLPIFVDDTPNLTIADLQSKIKQLKQNQAENLGLIVIDYLQLIECYKQDSRVQELSKITRDLKKLARNFDVPIIVLSQLSRNVEMRPNKRPILSDLRDSGSIEQDADVVMMLYRDGYYNNDSEEKDIMEIIVGKQRNGPVGTANVKYDGQYYRFLNLE